MELSALNPYLRYAKVHSAPTKRAGYSICYDCRAFFVQNASGSISINDEKYNFSNGDLIYLPPKTKYRFIFNPCENFKISVLNFDLVGDFSDRKESFGTATEDNFLPEKSPEYEICKGLDMPIIKNFPKAISAIGECTDGFLKRTPFYRERASAFLKLCLLEIVQKNQPKTAYSELCTQVISYIHENFADAKVTNAKIAEVFNYHPYHLSCIIKKETGKTLHQYLIFYRLSVAKNLLTTTECSIDEISWRCGFSSSAYFIKIFRMNNKMTPKQYKKINFHTEF